MELQEETEAFMVSAEPANIRPQRTNKTRCFSSSLLQCSLQPSLLIWLQTLLKWIILKFYQDKHQAGARHRWLSSTSFPSRTEYLCSFKMYELRQNIKAYTMIFWCKKEILRFPLNCENMCCYVYLTNTGKKKNQHLSTAL